MITPGYEEAVDKYVELFRSKKGFHEQTMDALAILAGTAESVAKFGDSVRALGALMDLIKSSDDEQFIIDEFYRLVFEK